MADDITSENGKGSSILVEKLVHVGERRKREIGWGIAVKITKTTSWDRRVADCSVEIRVGGIRTTAKVLGAVGLGTNVVTRVNMPIRQVQDLDGLARRLWSNIGGGGLGVKVGRFVNSDDRGRFAYFKVVVAESLIVSSGHGHLGVELGPVSTSTSSTVGKGRVVYRGGRVLCVAVQGVDVLIGLDTVVDQEVDKGVDSRGQSSKVKNLGGGHALPTRSVVVASRCVDGVDLIEVGILKNRLASHWSDWLRVGAELLVAVTKVSERFKPFCFFPPTSAQVQIHCSK